MWRGNEEWKFTKQMTPCVVLAPFIFLPRSFCLHTPQTPFNGLIVMPHPEIYPIADTTWILLPGSSCLSHPDLHLYNCRTMCGSFRREHRTSYCLEKHHRIPQDAKRYGCVHRGCHVPILFHLSRKTCTVSFRRVYKRQWLKIQLESIDTAALTLPRRLLGLRVLDRSPILSSQQMGRDLTCHVQVP